MLWRSLVKGKLAIYALVRYRLTESSTNLQKYFNSFFLQCKNVASSPNVVSIMQLICSLETSDHQRTTNPNLGPEC